MSLHITEYSRLARDAFGNVIPAGHEPARKRQAIAVSGTAAFSAGAEGSFVRLHAMESCLVNFGKDASGADPTQGHRMPAGAIEFFGVDAGTIIGVIAAA